MAPGPLPNPTRRRRNAPTIPTTALPASGRDGSVPRPPRWLSLGDAGSAWWRWAWKTPQAAGWDDGALVAIAHRAELEDDLAALAAVRSLDFLDVLEAEDAQAAKRAIRSIAALASGRLAILKEARELDGKLGLTPKGLADLRWKIVADAVEDEDHDEEPTAAPGVADLSARRRRIAGAT